MRIVYNKNYDSALSKEMLSLTNIEIVQVNPETGRAKRTQARADSRVEQPGGELELMS